MSDFFGIGATMKALVSIYTASARASGRTTRLVQALRPGDRVICQNKEQMRHLERRLREAGFAREDVTLVVMPAKDYRQIYERKPSSGRTYFDHGWVEEFYRDQINECAHTIYEWETRLSDKPPESAPLEYRL